MPFNGAGIFTRLRNWVDDATAGIKIRADYHDIEDDNFASGISNCIARDGQSVVLANLPMNSKRIVSLADPTDPQDASTKAYADTKMPLAGGTMNGPLKVIGLITSTIGYKCRAGVPGPEGGNIFNFNWDGSFHQIWVDGTNTGQMCTVAYMEQRASAWAHAVADPKVNRSGDTMTGGLTVNGELVAAATYIRFNYSGSPGYLLWNGGATYSLGGGGTIWHTGNLTPVTGARWVDQGNASTVVNGWSTRYPGVIDQLYWHGVDNGAPGYLQYINWKYLQVLTPNGYVTVG